MNPFDPDPLARYREPAARFYREAVERQDKERRRAERLGRLAEVGFLAVGCALVTTFAMLVRLAVDMLVALPR